jgi:hypothetical protein
VTTRPWRAPTTGTTVHLVGDLHNEVPAAAGRTRTESLRHDLPTLRAILPPLEARVQVGDVYHNYPTANSGPEVPWARGVLDLLADDGVPLVTTVGNHELNFGGDGDAIARRYDAPGRNHVVDTATMRFVVYGAADCSESGFAPGGDKTGADWVVPADVLAWMDQQIGATTRPVVLVSHCPPWEQYADDAHGFYLTPAADITALVAAHSNVTAWMSGHRHHWYQDAANLFHAASYGGRQVALIQAGCCGGTLDPDQRPAGHPVQTLRPNGSVLCTYFGPGDAGGHRWECRVRDHSIGCWGTNTTGYQHLWTIPLD